MSNSEYFARKIVLLRRWRNAAFGNRIASPFEFEILFSLIFLFDFSLFILHPRRWRGSFCAQFVWRLRRRDDLVRAFVPLLRSLAAVAHLAASAVSG